MDSNLKAFIKIKDEDGNVRWLNWLHIIEYEDLENSFNIFYSYTPNWSPSYIVCPKQTNPGLENFLKSLEVEFN